MTEHIKNFARKPGVQLWLAYLGLVMFGSLVTSVIGYQVVNNLIEDERQSRSAEIERLQRTNVSLLAIISDKLPNVVSDVKDAAQAVKEAADSTKEAAQVASDAATTANSAGAAAKRASSTARSASTAAKKAAATAQDVSEDVREVLTPKPRRTTNKAPKWLDGP